MNVSSTRRSAVAGCLAGLILCGAMGTMPADNAVPSNTFAPSVAQAKGTSSNTTPATIDEKAPDKGMHLLSYTTKSVIHQGLSFELPENFELDDDGNYQGYISFGSSYVAYILSLGSTFSENDDEWDALSSATTDDIANALSDGNGYTAYGVEEFNNDRVRVIAAYAYADSSPEINVGKLIVIGDKHVWIMELVVGGKTTDTDAASIDVIRQVAESMQIEEKTTKGKSDLLSSTSGASSKRM